MKTTPYKLFFLIAIVFLNVATVKSQVTLKTQNQNLHEFIQIWGLIKYKSQQSAAGKIDVDNVFLNLVDSVKNADNKQFNLIMLNLVSTVITSNTAKAELNNQQYLLKNLNYNWTKSKRYEKSLRQKLATLANESNPTGKHHYIPALWYEGDLPGEASYLDYRFNSEAMNLLALAKIWSAVEYLFPYKYVIGKDWKKTLAEMVPIFREIADRTSYEKGILMLEVAINDTHAGALLEEGNLKTTSSIFNVRYYPPFDYKALPTGIVVERFLTDSLEKANALKVGDKIVRINGIKVEQWLDERSRFIPASNAAVKYRWLSTSNNYRGDTFAFSNLPGNTLILKIKRNGSYLDVKLVVLDRQDKQSVRLIERDLAQKKVAEKTIKGMENIADDITLIRAGNFFEKDLPKEQDMAKWSAALKSKKAIIFDMRKYPQAPGLFNYYIPVLLGKAPFAFARYYSVDPKNVGAFVHYESLENYMYVKGDKPIGDLYTGKIVILTNEHTQSMGEWFTMMLSQLNGNTTIIGNQTAGADGDLKKLTLPGNYQFFFTGHGIFYPDGRETQRVGIKPDIYFSPNAKDLAGKTDAQLQRALKYIEEGK